MEPNINDKCLKICVGIVHTDLGVIVSGEEERKTMGRGEGEKGAPQWHL